MINNQNLKDDDMLSTISIAHRHFLFEKRNGVFQLKNDALLIMEKWDNLIRYIKGDNTWAESL